MKRFMKKTVLHISVRCSCSLLLTDVIQDAGFHPQLWIPLEGTVGGREYGHLAVHYRVVGGDVSLQERVEL